MINVIEELLGSGAFDQASADKLTSEWKTHTSNLNEEAKALRVEKEAMAKEVEKSKSDLDTRLAGIQTDIEEAKKLGQSEMVAQLEAEKAKHNDLNESLSGMQKTITKLTLDNAVAKELDMFDIRKEDKDLVSFRLRANVSLGEDGAVVFDDGVSASSITDGFTKYFEQNSNRLNPSGDGSQGSNSSNGGSGGGANSMERKAFEKLQPNQKSDFMAKGGQLTN